MEDKKLQAALEAWQQLQPLTEDDRNRLSRKFTVDFNYNSNHIEGNTLTYGQTEILLLFGKVIGEADFRDCEEMEASNVGPVGNCLHRQESGGGRVPVSSI